MGHRSPVAHFCLRATQDLRYRRLTVLRQAIISALVLLCSSWPMSRAAAEGTYRLVDDEGVIHFTDTPNDPRYRQISGTASGWLRVPAGARISAAFSREIREVAERNGVDPALVEAVIRVESAFNPWAVSPKGAQGLMQLMPRTANALGVRDSFNPRQNIEGGVRHLRYLLDRYPGNLSLAVAAYNAGEGAVDYYGGVPPFAETRQYVQKVLQRTGGDRVKSAAEPPPVIYRYQDADGTLTFSNIPPVTPSRSRRY
jgi:soluble lytic murein transglycosylase-like protein